MDNNLALVFITGLTTGGLSCLAVQGGLLASVISGTEKEYSQKLSRRDTLVPLIAFMLAKLVAYTVLGFILGLVGEAVSLSPYSRGVMQLFIAVYLAGVALAMLDIHPIFRHFIIKPPKALMRLAKNQSRSQSLYAPLILGALTVFLPCGTTQAMQMVALATGNPLYSALIMFAFVLGTAPTFTILGFLYSRASARFNKYFYPVAAALLFILSLYSLNNGLSLMGSVYTFSNFKQALTSPPSSAAAAPSAAAVSNDITIIVTNRGYAPRQLTVKAGQPVKLNLVTNNTFGCARAFTIPSLGVDKVLPATGTEVIEFTPTKPGPIVFTCSMGMYTGTIKAI